MSSSSSSLALALGDPSKPSTSSRAPPLQPTYYEPQESAQFFDTFIAETSRDVTTQQAATEPPPRLQRAQTFVSDVKTPIKTKAPVPGPPMSSPDPLTLKTDGSTTPRKRKPDELTSPSLKRIHSSDQFSVSRQRSGSSMSSSSTLKTTPQPSKRLSVYVEVPPPPQGWITPSTTGRSKSKSMPSTRTEGDLGGFSPPPESDWEDQKGHKSGSKSTGKRTGDRDERAPLEKLTAFIEDIFEAEDSLPPDPDLDALSRDWFSTHTVDSTRPFLAPGIIRKLTKLTAQIARPRKRMRLARDTPRKQRAGTLSEMETGMLSRLLKILERSVKTGEDIDPFHAADKKASQGKATGKAATSTKKTKTGKSAKARGKEPMKGQDGEAAGRGRSKSRTPFGEGGGEDDNAMDGEDHEDSLTEQDLQKLEKLLELAKESVMAADCCIALLAADKLPKQLYSEELITSCFATIKNQLTKVIYPFVEALGDVHGHTTPLLLHVAKSGDSSSQIYRREIGETFTALTAVLPRVNALVGSEVAMSDAIVIQAVYIAIGPFFVVELGTDAKGKKDNGNNLVLSALGGKGAMRALRLEALSLIRSIFANHEDQRSWIIEEILTSLIKLPDLKQKSGQFRLRDGRSIHTVSALLLQLVQTSAHDVRMKAKRLAINRQQSFVMRHDSQADGTAEPFLTERDHEEIQLYAAGLDSASKAAKTIVLFLTQRSGKGKATKSSNEAEYRAIFDNLISDLLTVLYWPEWPAAGLLLRIICRFMVSSLSDKTNNNTDNNAAKTVALDHLGIIAARLTTSSLKFKNGADCDGPLKGLEEILAKIDHAQLTRLVSVHHDVSNHLSKRSSEDQACDSARELSAVAWGHELTNALTHCNSILQKMEEEGEGSDQKAFWKLAEKVKSALRNVWQEAGHDVFDIGSEEDAAHVDRLAEELGTTQSLNNAFDPILNVILVSLDATAVFIRTKALRALGQIVTADPGILRSANVRKAIETHLLDSSPQVRDAAVELIGKYVVSIPEVAGDYYEQIAERIADTGLAVRKRVIKLLRTFYSVEGGNEKRIDICTKLVLRMNDEDDTVKDLAMKTIEDIWFGESQLQDASPRVNGRSISSPLNEKAQLLSKVSVIMGVSSQFRDRQSPLEELLHKVIMDKDGKDSRAIHARYTEIGNTLIDCLVDAQELPGFTVINCIKTIYLFVSAHPTIISTQQATTLLPYLKNATTAEEQITSDYLLKIFRVSTPVMSKTASKLAHELQAVLQQMLMKPSGPNWVATLQETVACICSVVRHLTHDFHLLVALVKSCNARLREHLARPVTQNVDVNTKKKLNLQVFIASLLCEHCDFDKLRIENTASALELNAIAQGSITEHIYGIMMQMYEKFSDPMIRARLLDCLGFLFRAYPTLMTLESSATIMDAIFSSPEEEARGRLLKIMQDFLITESTKQSAHEKAAHKTKAVQTKVNMEELVGNTDGFADSGVSSAIVQRYLPQILEAAMTRNVQMQAAAVDILGFTVKQGLAHPLQCLPVIVALETSPNPNLSNRTGALHTILYNKHHSLMNSRHLECARASFTYQRKVSAGVVRGYRLNPTPTALLHRWYTLVREKRVSRQDFLKTITKAFDLDSTNLSSTQDEIDFVRYTAENVSAFDYKTQEEVLTVIRHLTSVLSVVGMTLVETIAPTTLQGPADNAERDSCMRLLDLNPMPPAHSFDAIELARCSVAVGIILLLKSHLKSLYGLPEDKCSKWIPGKKSALGDKPATKRREVPLVWDRMPFATRPIRTEDEAVVQQEKFLELWAEDPVTAEPDDDPTEG
ncbi:ARM repeat-containing protein [Ramaria rubella]|nr:ARM repeat-containing protein [Ramaria rubella]